MKATTRRGPGGHSWIITLPLAGITVGYFLLCYRPAERKIAALEDDLRIIRQSLAEARTLPARVTHYRRELETTERYVEAGRSASPRSDVPGWFEAVSQAVKDAGARTTQFNPEPSVDHEVLTEVPLRLSCEGTFQQVLGAVRRIEELPHTAWLEEVKLERGPAQARVHCEMRLLLYCW